MSGWTPGALGEIVFGLFAIVVGVLQLLDPAQDLAEAHERRLRTGGSTDLRRLPRPERWLGLLFIAIGVTIILTFRSTSPGADAIFQLVTGGVLLVAAFLELVGRPLPQVRRYGRGLTLLLFTLFGGALLALGLIGLRP